MIRRIIICAVIIITAAAQSAVAGEAGTSGFMFLRLGNGARPSGLAEAFTAVSDDASSIYYNPAGMANVEGLELDLTHSEWLVDIRFEQITLVNEMLGALKLVWLSPSALRMGSAYRLPQRAARNRHRPAGSSAR